jgi:hypothetical protein
MHFFRANLVTNLASAATISICVLGIGFMLRFLLALTRERKTSLAGFRLEYRVNSSLPTAASMQTRPGLPVQALNGNEKQYERGESFTGTPQALQEVALTREYRFNTSSWQEPNRA